MIKFDIFIKNGKYNYKFNGYAYENEVGIINLEINTIPFSKKIILIQSSKLFKVP